jgi:hypothetical protein
MFHKLRGSQSPRDRALAEYRAFFQKWLHEKYSRGNASSKTVKISDSQRIQALDHTD